MQVYQISRLYFELVRERFQGENETTFDNFKSLVRNSAEEELNSDNKAALFSQVEALFAGHDDLIDKFRWTTRSFTCHVTADYNNFNNSSVFDESVIGECAKNVRQSSLDYVQRVKRTFEDKDKFKQFLDMLIDFQLHKNLDRMQTQASVMFKEHPELEIEIGGFLAQAIEKRSLTMQAFDNLRTDVERKRFLIRKANKYEKVLFDCEDDMVHADVLLENSRMTKIFLEELIAMLGKKTGLERIEIRQYLSALDIKCVKEVGCGEYLSDELVTTGKALRNLSEICFHLEKYIKHRSSDRLSKTNTEWAPLIHENLEKARRATTRVEWRGSNGSIRR